MKTEEKVNLLINSIDWRKQWEELTIDEQANYLSLRGYPYLNGDNEEWVKYHYLKDQCIVEDKGIDKLHLYI